MVRRAALQAQLVSPHVFRIELGVLGVIYGVGAAVEATGLEAAIGRHVPHQVVAEFLLQADRRRHRGPRGLGIERDRTVQAGERGAPEGAGGAVVVFLVLGPAHAGSHGPGRHKLPVHVRECRGGRGGQIIVNGAQERHLGAQEREQIVGIGFLVGRHVLLHVVRTKGGMQVGAVVVMQLEFLALLVLVQRHQHVTQLVLGRVDIDVGLGLELAVGADALQRELLVDVPVHRQRGTGMLQVLAFAILERGLRTTIPFTGFTRLQHDDTRRRQAGLQQWRHRTAQGQCGILLGGIQRQHSAEVVGRLVGQLGAECLGVIIVVALPTDRILDVTVIGDLGAGNAAGQGVAELAGDVEAAFQAAVVTRGDFHRTAFIVEGVLGGQLDRAAGGVLAVQRALRATQHFQLLDVEQREQRAIDARVVDIVHIHAHARVEGLQRVGLADTADEDVDAVGRATPLGNVHIGHGALQALNGRGLQILDLLLAERAHRHRHVLNGLAAAACGDGHFVQLRGLGACGRLLLLRLHECSRCQQNAADGHAQILALHWSPSSRV